MPSITLTASASDAQRLKTVATALGYPDIASLVVAIVKQQVSSWEQQNQPPPPLDIVGQ